MMKEWETMKLYGPTVNRWTRIDELGRNVTAQREIQYREFREDGTLCGVGTEDFSRERWETVGTYDVWAWDGVSYNKGGHRAFVCVLSGWAINPGDIRKLRHIAEKRRPGYSLYQARKW